MGKCKDTAMSYWRFVDGAFVEGFCDDTSRTGAKGAIPEGRQTSDLTIFNLDEPGGGNPAAM